MRAKLNRPGSWLSYDLANLVPGRKIDAEVLDELETRLIAADVGRALREIYAVCSNAIHGNAPNDQQLAFVRDVAPGVLSVLKTIASD